MVRSPRPRTRRAAVLAAPAVALVLALGACSSDEPSSPTTTAAGSVPGSTTGTTVASLTDEQRLAAAKTLAVGFFEAQAINEYDAATQVSTEAAALTVEWARAVNGIAAVQGSGYEVPTVQAPNVRVQIDALTADGAGRWQADGFVELSFRPGPVVSTTSTTAPSGAPTTEVAPPEAPATYVVDLVFVEDGPALKVADYRLDDVPYPVSQLFTAFTATDETAGATGEVVLGHRDLDGSVQYVASVTPSGDGETTPGASTFTPAPEGTTTGTATVPPGPDTVTATTFADPIPGGATADVLVVLPGAFPGSAGTLTLEVDGAATTTTTGAAEGETRPLAWALPDFPELTPRPVGTVTTSTTTSTSSTSTSTTSTTVESSTTAPTTAAPPSSTPTTATPSSTTSTTTATTTSTTEP